MTFEEFIVAWEKRARANHERPGQAAMNLLTEIRRELAEKNPPATSR